MLFIKGYWHVVKGKLIQKLACILEDDLQFTEGKEEELKGRIAMRKAEDIANPAQTLEPSSTCHHHCK